VRMVELVLAYYDKTYGYGLADRHALTVAATSTNAAENAKLVLSAVAEMPFPVSSVLSSNDSKTTGSSAHE
jgi:hypothetical protein